MKNSVNSLGIREPYRALITAGRTYAAFNKATTIPLIDDLRHHQTIFDPMAGFGTLMNLCSAMGVSTLNLEYNPPSYLWGVLNNPRTAPTMMKIVDDLLSMPHKITEPTRKAEVSDDWFSPGSRLIILELYSVISQVAAKRLTPDLQQDLTLAVLIPFSGRLGCYVPGNIVANVKQGGICVYHGASTDFDRYLITLRQKLVDTIATSTNNNHEFRFGDLITFSTDRRFSAFITSPPYPNSRDYHRMFAPENNCLSFLREKGLVRDLEVQGQLIGSVLVSKYKGRHLDFHTQVSSQSARKFIQYIADFKGKKRQSEYDNYVYYVPYFTNYFYQLEQAYRNLLRLMADKFEGYIVVVNNTARNTVIPVAKSLIELFQLMGVQAQVVDNYTRELSHVGTINPKVKGFKAKHMEYTIKVWRS